MFSKFRSYRFNLIEIQLASIKNAPVVYMLEIPPGGSTTKCQLMSFWEKKYEKGEEKNGENVKEKGRKK